MDKVRSQYERWIYPAPVDDLVAWTAGGGITIGDAKDFADLYWPDTGYREGMNILAAGCGANQAARYAFVHPLRTYAKRSIRQCIEASGNDPPAAELPGHGLRFFRSLSRTGHVVFRLNTKAS